MTRRSLTGFIAIFVLALPGAMHSAELIHDPILSAPAGQSVSIRSQITGMQGDTSVRLYYRRKGSEQYRSKAMLGATRPSAKIPGKFLDIGGLEYYIEVRDSTGTATSPHNNAKISPHYISVRKDQGSPEITIMSPLDGEKMDTDTPVVTASFFDDDSGIDVDSIQLWIDGKKAKGATKFETLLSWLPSKPLSQGVHKIRLRVSDESGNSSEAAWVFSVDSEISSKAKGSKIEGWVWNGNVRAETRYAATLDEPDIRPSAMPYRPDGINRGNFNLNGRGEENSISLKIYKTDEERSDQQAVDRYAFSWQGNHGKISIGDSSPNFSELSLYQLAFLRGVTLDLQSGSLFGTHTRFIAVGGRTRRATDAGASGLSGAGGTASYLQNLYGARWEVGGKYFGLGWNAVTINDQVDNFKSGLDPVYNFVVSNDVYLKIPQWYFKADGEYASSFYASAPTPLNVAPGVAYQAGAEINAFPIGTRLDFEWRDLGGTVPGVQGILPTGFNTLANPGIINDYRGYESNFDQILMDGQISLGLSLNNWRDNLQGAKPATTTTNFVSLNTTLALTNLPYLSVGYTTQAMVNDATGNTSQAIPDFIRDDLSKTINVSVGYTKPVNPDLTLNGNISYVKTTFKDQAPLRLSQDLDSTTLVLSAFASLKKTTANIAFSRGGTEQPAVSVDQNLDGLPDIVFSQVKSSIGNISFRLNQDFVPQVFNAYVAFDRSTNSTDTPGSFTVQTQSARTTLSIGAGYEPKLDHRLNAGISHATVTTTKTPVADNKLAMLLTTLSYDYSF